ncbi:MAG: cytidylate kinase-like family protein [Clostridiales bacterium]|nr:cytidylate kinase-like family protein [Clostridiales bacterium]
MKKLITVGRQYGSGGGEVGKKLAEALNIPFYDSELVEMAAKESDMHPDVVKQADEKATDSLLYSLITGGGLRGVSDAMQYDMPINDKVFIKQSKVIKELAAKGSGVFVGRCADYVLDGCEGLLRVFIYADIETRIARVAEYENLTPQKAKDVIVKTERRRKTYYNYYTDRTWGSISGYDLCINTTNIGIDGAVELIKCYVEKKG